MDAPTTIQTVLHIMYEEIEFADEERLRLEDNLRQLRIENAIIRTNNDPADFPWVIQLTGVRGQEMKNTKTKYEKDRIRILENDELSDVVHQMIFTYDKMEPQEALEASKKALAEAQLLFKLQQRRYTEFLENEPPAGPEAFTEV